MAERRESLRGKTRNVPQPTSSHSEGESHFSLSAINPELCPELEPTRKKAAGARRKLKYSGQGGTSAQSTARRVPRRRPRPERSSSAKGCALGHVSQITCPNLISSWLS